MILVGNGLAEVHLVQVLLLVGEAGEVGNPVPAGEGVAIAGGLCGLAHHAVGVGNALHGIVAVSELATVSSVQDIDFVLVRLDGYSSAAIGELSTICRKRKLGLGRLLGSSSLAILIGVIGQCYCRHATKSERQAQACRNCFLRTRILHLFSFSHCISPRPYASD